MHCHAAISASQLIKLIILYEQAEKFYAAPDNLITETDLLAVSCSLYVLAFIFIQAAFKPYNRDTLSSQCFCNRLLFASL